MIELKKHTEIPVVRRLSSAYINFPVGGVRTAYKKLIRFVELCYRRLACSITTGETPVSQIKRIFLLSLFCLTGFNLPLLAQQDALSTVALEGITIQGSIPEKYVAGSKIQEIDSAILAQMNNANLASLLMQQSPVYVKQYGNGMLSSVSFRGTSAGHTSVLWNGINLNSLTTGETDFSTIPLFVFDKVELQYGSASSLYGSDAIGGSIHMGNPKKVNTPFSLDVQQDFGSFGQFFSGIKSSYKTGKFSGSTKLYRYAAENNFPYENFTQPGNPTEKQKNAAVLYQGVLQNLNYQFNPQRQLSVSAWYHHHDREVQPRMVDTDQNDVQEDENLRVITNFSEATHFGIFDVNAGFVHDDLLYNKTFRTASTRFIAAFNYEYDFTENISIRVGTNWNYIRAESDNYETRLTENRNDFYASLRYQPYPFWTTTFNARQAFVTGFSAPFAPSWGNDIALFNLDNHELSLKTLVARSYRVPTLNNRYWTPGGNPDLLPEDGLSVEGGAEYQFNTENLTANLEATYYQMWVDDWIIWLPLGNGGIWSPENIRKVNAKGFEFNGKATQKFGKLNLTLGGNYAYTRSINKEGLNEFDRSVGKQLPYVPFHRATVYVQVKYKQWNWHLNTNYTGYRYTSTDNENFLEGFTLVNTGLERKINISKSLVSLAFQVDNLFDVAYQNLPLRAMPGRSYNFSIRYHFSTNSQP